MRGLKLLVIAVAVIIGISATPILSHAQQSWAQRLAVRYAQAISRLQDYCIEKGKVECELLEVEQDPPFLLRGQTVDYVGVRQRGVLYFYLVVAERDDMDPDIYLFDSRGNLLAQSKGVDYFDLAVHVPEYTQKVIERIRMDRGSGHIAVAVLAPVGVN